MESTFFCFYYLFFFFFNDTATTEIYTLSLHDALRDLVHRSVSPCAVRLQRRRPAMDVASRLLHLRRARDRPVPAVLTGRRCGLPRRVAGGVSAGVVPRAGARQVVAARHSPLPDRRTLHRWRIGLDRLGQGRSVE